MDANGERASRLDTSTISDALDRLGIPGQCLGIKPRFHGFQLTGRAFTLLYAEFDPERPGTVGDYIDDLGEGTVVVIDNNGRQDATVWGDLLTYIADRKKLAGTVIDGACRDVHLCRDIGYPVFSRSYSMRTGKDRVQVADQQVPVTIGGAVVAPGDLLRGDCDGVVVIPVDREEEVLDVAEDIDSAEARIRDQLKQGVRLDEAREKLGYHGLQTREE